MKQVQRSVPARLLEQESGPFGSIWQGTLALLDEDAASVYDRVGPLPFLLDGFFVVNLLIREFHPGDADALRQCVIALQDFERTIDPRVMPGEAMADEYCSRMHARCRETDGRVFVAEHGSTVVGFVAVRAREPFTELDDPPGTYALVSDLAVLARYRGQGIGRRLLEHAEAFARDAGAEELRVGVLSKNTPARELYRTADFVPHLEIFAKRL